MNFLSQLLLFLCVAETFCNQLDWCLYFKLRNIDRPECKYYDITRERPAIKRIIDRLPNKDKFRKIASLPLSSISNIPPSQPIVSSMTSFKPPICSAYSKHCTYSTMCDGGMQVCNS
ncbi:unnamed protein product [Auanema sp. JU1783]|nr:unnamed protein product [Auanema sp. JU1783]